MSRRKQARPFRVLESEDGPEATAAAAADAAAAATTSTAVTTAAVNTVISNSILLDGLRLCRYSNDILRKIAMKRFLNRKSPPRQIYLDHCLLFEGESNS
ncbi:hypothetical protein LSTR_LSTR015340 [Laodelphax striatellus]|uniref:Uncharacterized protein n=1 Tax=Laodelphax striatellus TaxID=195883 RepID=A0A482WVS5_LAOST|nr:hypothetical protein LSTR_LSTR015340 [Laodelphax striatellus]